MAKHLLIMRHAKSSWSDINSTDHERTLNRRGLRDTPRMGQFIASQNCQPDLIASSTAQRAKMTAELFIENCDGVEPTQLELVDDFYHAGPRAFLSYLSMIENAEVKTAMVIGHNPGLESLVARLGGVSERMPTAAIARFRLNIDCWSETISEPNAELLTVWRPKELDF